MYQPPSDIAIITEILVQLGAILLICSVFIWKIAYAMKKDVWKCMDRCDPLSGFLLILPFVFIPGSLLLHHAYRKIRKLLKRRHNRYNEIEDKYKWFSEHA